MIEREDKAVLRAALQRWVLCLLLGIVTFFGLAFFYLRAGYLYDADSYVHLAVSRLYVDEGFVRGLPWPRFSVMHEQYGDKELLFHAALMPLVATMDAAVAGRIALAGFGATLVMLLALLFMRHIRLLGLVIPWWLLAASPPFLNRVIRLRPEILGLILFLLAAAFFIRRRWVALGVVAFLFPLSYTAFHVLMALVVGWAALEWFRTRTLEWQPVAWTAGGIALGNIVHPHALDHLKIWWMQNVSYFRWKGVVEVEEEIRPPSWQEVLFVNGGWWILALAVVALIVWQLREFPLTRETIVYGSTALLFLVLYLRMGRMVLYAMPFLALTLSAALSDWREREGEAPAEPHSASTARQEPRPPGALALTRISVLIALMLLALPLAWVWNMRLPFFERAVRAVEDSSERELEQFGRSVPPGAKIAADWGDTQLYAFWAPQGRYLNMYDPLFMAAKDAEPYEALRALFAGRVLDVPPVVHDILESDYLAIQTPWDNPRLNGLLVGDPRWRVRHQGANVLLELQEPEQGEFVRNWMVRGPQNQSTALRVDGEWSALVQPGEGCRELTAIVSCDGCTFSARAAGTARIAIDGELVREIRSPEGISPWTWIENVSAQEVTVNFCGSADGGFFLFQSPSS